MESLPSRAWPLVNGFQSMTAHRFRLAALVVTGCCVLALAGDVFAVSYPGARDIAVTAGVPGNLARVYPAIFDAVLLVAFAAAVVLRGMLRGWAWLTILVVVVAVAGMDTAHAMKWKLPPRPLEATAAIVPWAALLVGFTLLYAMARQWRPGRDAATPAAAGNGQAPVTGSRWASTPANGDAAAANRAAVVPLSTLLAGRPGAVADGPPDQAVSPGPDHGAPGNDQSALAGQATAPAQRGPTAPGQADAAPAVRGGGAAPPQGDAAAAVQGDGAAPAQGPAEAQADGAPQPAEPAALPSPVRLHGAPAD